jgi:hypothetical protein
MSVPVLTHSPAQLVSPLWQESVHEPLEQTSPALHTLPQVPQLARSVERLTQVPEQFFRPA